MIMILLAMIVQWLLRGTNGTITITITINIVSLVSISSLLLLCVVVGCLSLSFF